MTLKLPFVAAGKAPAGTLVAEPIAETAGHSVTARQYNTEMTTSTAGAAGTRQRFDADLGALEERLCAMGLAAARMLEDATRALTTGDDALAWSVVERDEEIDDLDRAVEESALLLVARQQPVASDLRLLGAALKMTTDLERIGDHAVNIARVALRIQGGGLHYRPLVDIPRFATIAAEMVRGVVDALQRRDLCLARRVARRDDELDILYKEAQRDLRAVMKQPRPESTDDVLLASHLLFITHYLERVGDHCTSIAERLDYQETGRSPLPRAAKAAASADEWEDDSDIA